MMGKTDQVLYLSTPCASCGTEKRHTIAAHFGPENSCCVAGCDCKKFVVPETATK